MKDKIALTNQEKVTLVKLYSTSKSNKEIAKSLGVSVASVKFHAWNIYNKLGVSKRIELKDLNPKLIERFVDEK